jgi:hypothetical protein
MIARHDGQLVSNGIGFSVGECYRWNAELDLAYGCAILYHLVYHVDSIGNFPIKLK